MNAPSTDVIVIGGGLSGLSAAVDMASHGLSVHLVERHLPAGDDDLPPLEDAPAG
jgi:phytoene dehydrogenase-like protein